jgi:hypothetical protein
MKDSNNGTRGVGLTHENLNTICQTYKTLLFHMVINKQHCRWFKRQGKGTDEKQSAGSKMYEKQYDLIFYHHNHT